MHVDLNCDLGESFGAYTIGMDEAVIPHISSANIACGWHAGDPLVMQKTVAIATAAGVSLGAHPGHNDLMGFGRRTIRVTPAEAKACIQYQVGALMAFAQAAGTKLHHVKPHGALYNQAAVDMDLALALCRGVYEIDHDLVFLGLDGSRMIDAARQIGMPYASEVFADRAYLDDGTLMPRSQPGSVLHDEQLAIRRTLQMVTEGTVQAASGKTIAIQADSICVHGDNPSALEFVKNIRAALEAKGVEIRPF